MTFSSIMSKCLWLQTKDSGRPHRQRNREAVHACFSQQHRISSQAVSFQYAEHLLFSTALPKEIKKTQVLEQYPQGMCYIKIKGQRHTEFKQANLLDAMDPGGFPDQEFTARQGGLALQGKGTGAILAVFHGPIFACSEETLARQPSSLAPPVQLLCSMASSMVDQTGGGGERCQWLMKGSLSFFTDFYRLQGLICFISCLVLNLCSKQKAWEYSLEANKKAINISFIFK